MTRSGSVLTAGGRVSAEPHWRFLVVLSVAHFLTDISQGVIPALGVFLRDVYSLSYTQIGILSLVLAVASGFAQPLAGIYSDRNPTGWMIPLGVAAVGVGFLGVASTGNFVALLLFVALAGCGVAIFHPEAMGYARALVGRRMATGMSVFQVGGNLGVGLGPVLVAAVWALLELRGILLIALIPLAWATVITVLLPRLREAGQAANTAAVPAHAGAAGRRQPPVREDRWDAEIRTLIAVVCRSTFQISMGAFLPFYYVDVLGVDEHWSTVPLSVYWIAGAAGTLLTGPLADRITPRRYFMLALASVVPLHFLALTVPSSLKLAVFAMQGFTLVSTMAVSIVLCQDYLPNHRALASGLNVGLGQGLGGAGAAMAGTVADVIGLVPAMYLLVLLPLTAAVVAATLPPVEL